MEATEPKEEADSPNDDKTWKKSDDIPKRFDELVTKEEWIPVADVIRRQREAAAEAEQEKIKITPPTFPPVPSASKSMNHDQSEKKITPVKKEVKKEAENKTPATKRREKEKQNPKDIGETNEEVDAVTKAMMDWALKTDYDPRKRIGRRSSLPAFSSKDMMSMQGLGQSKMKSTEVPESIQKQGLKVLNEQEEETLKGKEIHKKKKEASGPPSDAIERRRASMPAVPGYSPQKRRSSKKKSEVHPDHHNRTPSPDYRESDELEPYNEYEWERYYEHYPRHPEHDYHDDYNHEYHQNPQRHSSLDYDDRYYDTRPEYDKAKYHGRSGQYDQHQYPERGYVDRRYSHPHPHNDSARYYYRDPNYRDHRPHDKYDRYYGPK